MSTDEVKEHVKAILQAQIIKAFNDTPDAIEKLVKAALEPKVDAVSGRADGYSHTRIPYLDYLIGDTVRQAARAAVSKIVSENSEMIEAKIREHLSSDKIAEAVTTAFVKAAGENWRIDVNFEIEKHKY